MSITNNTSVFEYLIKKLESRIKNMHKTKIAINNIVDLNELRENRTYMLKHFSEIEDEINQSIHSLKALLTQNADVCEHAEICLKKARGHELKLIGETKKNIELMQINEELNKEILSLKTIIEEKNTMVVFLNEKISFYEQKIEEKDKEITEMKKDHERNNDTIKRLVQDIEILKIELDAQNFNNEEVKKEDKEIDIDNLKGIISERETKKKMINEKIKDHFKSNKNNKKFKGKIFINIGINNNTLDDFNENQIPLQMKNEKKNKSKPI
jgi:chromosome segregation ATPase